MRLTAHATVPRLQQAGPVVINFDDLGTTPGRVTVVSDQYADLGVTFNNPQVRDFAAGGDDGPAFTHSGSDAAQQCFSAEFCRAPLIMTFAEPQGRVKVWVGLREGIDDAMQVTMTAFDEDQGGQEIATASAALGPSGSREIPVQTPLEVTANGGVIRRVEVGFSPPSEFAANLVFDDVEFELAPGQVDCPNGTSAPEIVLDEPADDADVQIEDFTLQGRVDPSTPLTEATLTVANADGIVPVDVLARLPQERGAFGPLQVDDALEPGENTISLSVDDCSSAEVTIEYSPIKEGTEYDQLGLEVTQTIQDTDNSVVLIAGKKTYVRVYLGTFGGTREIRSVSGKLRGCTIDDDQDDVHPDCFGTTAEFLPALEPLYRVTVNDADSRQAQRENLHPPADDEATKDKDERDNPMAMNFGLLFELPSEWTQAGLLRLQLDEKSLSPELPCKTCKAVTEVRFVEASPVVLDLVDVTYESGGKVYEPREIDRVRLESWLERAYPTNDVRISTVSPLSIDTPIPDCYGVNTAMYTAQSAGQIASPSVVPNAHARYYGLVSTSPGTDFEGCAGTDKKRTRINQYAVGHAGAGAPYIWDDDGSYADFYGGHELGHTYGREHPGGCEGKDDNEQPDPFEDGHLTDWEHDYLGFDTGVHISSEDLNAIEGIKDIKMTVYPGAWTDVMTYCNNRWMSARTYNGILAGMVSERTVQPSLSRSIAPVPGNRVLVVSGIIDTLHDSATLSPFLLLPGDLVSPRPASSTYNIDLRDGAGGVTTYPFEPWFFTDQLPATLPSPPPPPQFAQLAEVVPWVDGTVSIDIRIANKVVKTVPVTATPVVTLTSPNGGEPLGGTKFPVTWTASDVDSTGLTYTLLYSADDGVTWQTAAGNIKDTQFLVDPDRLPGSTTARFRVIATDGVSTAQDDSDASFAVADKAPRVNIDSPGDGATFTSAHTVVLTGNATDVERGELDGPAMTWSSNLQGALGEGRSIAVTNLTPGQHIITLTANDGKTPAVKTSISITITDANPPHLVWPDSASSSQLRQGQFVYDGDDGVGAFYTTDGAGGIQRAHAFDPMLNGWTAIVPGTYGGDETTDLLFYAAQSGVGEFFASTRDGELQLLSGSEGFTRGWDIIVPGEFDDDAWTDLFFYNADAEEGKFYTTDGTGRIRLLGEPGRFRNGWTAILAGEFGGDDHTDLLFYDKAAGLGQLFTTDGQGGLELLNDDVDFTAGWDQIVPGNFGGEDGLTDLFLFDADTGNATFLSADGTGGFVLLGDVEPFSTRWTTIMSGDFGGERTLTDLFFYDAEQGLGKFYLSNGHGGLEPLNSSDNFPKGWDLIVPGYFERS
ncbi:MAG: hypothetical protein U0075_13765 [Thermomicrobiales bacterium]